MIKMEMSETDNSYFMRSYALSKIVENDRPICEQTFISFHHDFSTFWCQIGASLRCRESLSSGKVFWLKEREQN